MELTQLSPRLGLIASLVTPGVSLADVGTDHAYLPTALLLAGKIRSAVATDINRGPLSSAAEHARSAGVLDRIRLVLCDGLALVAPDEADEIVIAGMGGETMAGILAAAPWTKRGARLILQPQSKLPELRRWLYENGYRIDGEYLVRDAGRIYTVMTARGGSAPVPDTAELYVGEARLQHSRGLFGEYLRDMSRKLERISLALERSARPEDTERLREYREAAAGINEILTRGDDFVQGSADSGIF